MTRLVHWSYDSPWNPLFGGGGAQRDWEILRRLQGEWSVDYRVGGFPGAAAPERVVDAVEFLGAGQGRWGGRVSYALAANRRAASDPPRDGIWSISPSIFAPVPAYLAHPERTAVSLFHLVGWGAWRKYGPAGLVAVWHEKRILSRMRHFLCINNATAATVRAARPDALVDVVPTGFTPLAGPDRPRGGDPEILFFGRMDVYMKGIDRLVEAFAAVGRSVPAAKLVLAGRADAAVSAKIASLVEGHPLRDRIRLEFSPDDGRKAELFRSASVFCSPSRFEGWCIAAVEAQSCGVPVVASTADGFLDSVDDGRSGILVPNDDGVVAGVASALTRILQDGELASRLGEGGRAKAAGLTWDAVARRHGEIFRRVAEGAA